MTPKHSPSAAPPNSPSPRPFWRIAREYFLRGSPLAVSLILIVLIAAADTFIPFLVMVAIDLIEDTAAGKTGLTPAAAFAKMVVIALEMLGLVGLVSLATYGITRQQNSMVYRGAAKLRDELFRKMQAQPVTFMSDRRMGEILSHLVGDVKALQDALLDLVFEIPFDVATVGGLLIVIFFLNLQLGLIFAGFMLAVAVISILMGRRGWSDQKSAMDDAAVLMTSVHESLGGLRAIQAFGASGHERERVDEASRLHAEGLEQAGELRAVVKPFFGFAEYAGIVLVLLAGGWQVLNGRLSAGGLIAVLAYMEMAADPMVRGAQLIPKIQMAGAAAARLNELLFDIGAPLEDGKLQLAAISGNIRAEKLGLSYPKGGRAALSGLNFEVKSGERIAVVGPNGAGKSTLLDMLLKLLAPSEGTLTSDGVDLAQVSSESWRKLVGVVLQDTHLLNRSIAENIALGSAGLAGVEAAAKAAGLDSVIARFPQGYETLPGEHGARLSGGERQRIAIARLFLRNPRVVLLDEPTSALDLQAEAELLPALEQLCAGRTTFVVSHRAAVLRRIDKVLLLAGGKQLAFDAPAAIWKNFPEHRELFPPVWAAEK